MKESSRGGHPDHDVGEGQVGQQLTVAGETVEPLHVALARPALRVDEIAEGSHPSKPRGRDRARGAGRRHAGRATPASARRSRRRVRGAHDGLADEAAHGERERRLRRDLGDRPRRQQCRVGRCADPAARTRRRRSRRSGRACGAPARARRCPARRAAACSPRRPRASRRSWRAARSARAGTATPRPGRHPRRRPRGRRTRSAASVAALRRGPVEVAHDLLVALERGGDVHHRVVGPVAAHRERGGDPGLAELRPARRPVDPGQHVDAGAPERRADPRQLARVERAELRLPARRSESGALVGEPERESDRRRVGVGIHECRRAGRRARARRRARSRSSIARVLRPVPTPR